MSLLSRLMVLIGVLSLFHAAYSAHEFSTLSSRLHKNTALPVDIQVETLIAVALSCLGLVLGSQPLKPISWSTWAGEIEKEGDVNPFASLENRVGFMDIRAKREEFAQWMKGQDVVAKK